MKALFKDNFHFSISPTLVQPQYPKSKKHSSSIAAAKEVNRTHHVRRGRSDRPDTAHHNVNQK